MTGAGAAEPGAARPRRARAPRGLRQKLGSVILAFEAVIVGLCGLTIFGLKAFGPDVAPWWGIVGGSVVGVAMLLTAGFTGTRAGIVVGWILQVVVLLSAIAVPAILFVVIVFGGMWTYAMIVGSRVDRASAARAARPDGLPDLTPSEPPTESD